LSISAVASANAFQSPLSKSIPGFGSGSGWIYPVYPGYPTYNNSTEDPVLNFDPSEIKSIAPQSYIVPGEDVDTNSTLNIGQYSIIHKGTTNTSRISAQNLVRAILSVADNSTNIIKIYRYIMIMRVLIML
jgi:hypothetical protein